MRDQRNTTCDRNPGPAAIRIRKDDDHVAGAHPPRRIARTRREHTGLRVSFRAQPETALDRIYMHYVAIATQNPDGDHAAP